MVPIISVAWLLVALISAIAVMILLTGRSLLIQAERIGGVLETLAVIAAASSIRFSIS